MHHERELQNEVKRERAERELAETKVLELESIVSEERESHKVKFADDKVKLRYVYIFSECFIFLYQDASELLIMRTQRLEQCERRIGELTRMLSHPSNVPQKVRASFRAFFLLK
jgi:hypothetical protein